MKKLFLAVGAVALGVAAMGYVSCARSLTLAHLGLSVPQQLMAQRALTCGIFAALAVLPFGAAFLARRLPPCEAASKVVRFLKVAALALVPVFLTLATLRTPFWSMPSPASWNRPRFVYGWPLPWKNEAGMVLLMFMPCVNWFLWTLYVRWLLGCRRLRSFLVTVAVAGGLALLLLFVSGTLPNHAVFRRAAPRGASAQHPAR